LGGGNIVNIVKVGIANAGKLSNFRPATLAPVNRIGSANSIEPERFADRAKWGIFYGSN